MWNQVGSECAYCTRRSLGLYLCLADIAVLLIRTYAFFNRNIYILWFLISAIAGVVTYQLYVDTSQMLRSCSSLRSYRYPIMINRIAVLPFVKPPFVRFGFLEPRR